MTLGITTFGGDGGKSGISQYIINLLRQFSLQDDAEDMEVLVYEDEKDIFIPSPSRLRPLCFPASLRRPVVNIAWHQWALPRLCRTRRYSALFLPAANRRAPAFCPCPTVGTVHDFSSLHVRDKYDPARMAYIRYVLPFLARRLTRVLTVSESSRKDIVEYAGVPEERVTVIPLAADRQRYTVRDKQEAMERVRTKYGLDRPYALYISRIEHPGKNHVRLIHAFARIKERSGLPHLLALAGTDWGRAAEVHSAAEQTSCAEDIRFTGFVDAEDIPYLYNAAEAFVFPSLYEGFGLPVLEAMSSGTPVACSNLSSLPEVAGDAGIMFNPYDEEEIAEALMRLLTDTEKRETCIRRGLERSALFTWEKTAQRTLEILRDVM